MLKVSKHRRKLSKFDERLINIKKIQEFNQRYHLVIDEFQTQYKKLLLFITKLKDRENTALDRMGKLHFFDWQNRQTLSNSYLNFYYENLDWMKATFRNIQESRKKLRSMRKELKRVERFVSQLE